jgi:phospho-N-acetylmuramoyl-pentapeptide-transferase
MNQIIRYDGPKTHIIKKNTPTMGGALILCSFIVSSLIWSDWHNHYIWILLAAVVIFGGIGILDDMLKIKYKNANGLTAKKKYLIQSLGTIIIIVLFLLNDHEQHYLIIPFVKDHYIYLGLTSFFILSYLIIVGASNAVNLTDGLDGLAIMPVILIATTFAIIAYLSGNYNFANYLNIPYLNYSNEIVIICSALIGSGLGFLWFNTYPADIFMGDIGSLAIGSILAVIAISLHQELLLPIAGGIFVIETLSVILQVGSYKMRKKRIFLMAPIHHHFEKKGLSEPKIIVRFWMITLILVLISLISLKIR